MTIILLIISVMVLFGLIMYGIYRLALLKTDRDFYKGELETCRKDFDGVCNSFDELSKNYTALQSQKKSSEVSLGLVTEQLAPFMADFAYNPRHAHFLGQPIDYVIFEDDKIVFCEVKMNRSQMTPWQRKIKKLVEDKKVEWYSYTLKPKNKGD